jgi:transposase-like protein
VNVAPYLHFSSNVSGATNNVYMHPKATVDKARLLSSKGLNDCEVARRVGVSVGAVRKWRTGQRRAPGKKFGLPRCPLCHGVPPDEPLTRTSSAST